MRQVFSDGACLGVIIVASHAVLVDIAAVSCIALIAVAFFAAAGYQGA